MSHKLCRELCKPQAGQKFSVGTESYELAGKIGDGAAGLVRKATRIRDKTMRAIKFLAPDPKYIEEATFDDVASRFRREGQRGAKLDHAHLIRIHCYVENENGNAFDDGPQNPFLIMDYVDGKSLESYIKNLPDVAPVGEDVDEEQRPVCPLDITIEQLDLAIQIAQGLEYLHKQKEKLIHRDIKPANIFLSKQQASTKRYLARIGDFGIVKWGDFHASLTTGILTVTDQRGLGTLKYMSPEQAIAPNKVSTKSDMYSLGVTLFELFTGRILASSHHVFEAVLARLDRGTAVSRFYKLGYRIDHGDSDICEAILDMHLRGQKGRPNIDQVLGILRRRYEHLSGHAWRAP
jgi:eukaryotic-like serine/threonine-protein kinase